MAVDAVHADPLHRTHIALYVTKPTLQFPNLERRLPLDPALERTRAAQLSMMAGVPLGPEMPVVVLCAGAGSVLVLPFTLSGPIRRAVLFATMAGGLSTFFGVPIAGAFFALEIPHRMGIEFYEVREARCAAWFPSRPRADWRWRGEARFIICGGAPKQTNSIFPCASSRR